MCVKEKSAKTITMVHAFHLLIVFYSGFLEIFYFFLYLYVYNKKEKKENIFYLGKTKQQIIIYFFLSKEMKKSK